MKVKSKKLKVKIFGMFINFVVVAAFCVFVNAQEPAPSAPKSVKVPAVKEKILRNGLKVVVVEKRDLPLVSVLFQTSQGSNGDYPYAGTANLMTNLLTKGTKTRSATQIAEGMEFLGGTISSGASFLTSEVSIGITSDKLNQAMAIMADVILNPAFKQSEIDLAKKQTIDDLTYQMTQPSSLANFVATTYIFDEWLRSGTIESVSKITRKEVLKSYREQFKLQDATLIFTGNISANQAFALAQRLFGKGVEPIYLMAPKGATEMTSSEKTISDSIAKKIIVIDLPNSGQSSVLFAKQFADGKKVYDYDTNKSNYSKIYFPALVTNSLFGGGYSSRLNQEVRIKRGLSYGAFSSLIWRSMDSKFIASCQTKNESAAEVAELMISEIKRLTTDLATKEELLPRKVALTGEFGRNLETTGSLTNTLSDLNAFDLDAGELNSYMNNISKVTPEEVRSFANNNLTGGDIIIVGDYQIFKEDLAKRFPNQKIEVIKADKLDLNKLK